MPFNNDIVKDVLAQAGSYVGLLNGTELQLGVLSYTEPTIDTTATGENGGYKRGKISGWDDQIKRQIANKELVLMFEARSALVGQSFNYFGLFSSDSSEVLRFYGELSETLTISAEGYVPLIRAWELIIGMDTVISTDYK